MKYKVLSRTDVITNSSTEVFCYKLSDPEYTRIKSEIPWLSWTEFKTESDIRDFVMSPDYHGFPDAQVYHGPENIAPDYDALEDYGFREFLETKDPSESWEFLKSGYMNLLGYSIASFDNDCISSKYLQEVWDFLGKIQTEKVLAYMSQFPDGTILKAPVIYGQDLYVVFRKDSDTEYTELPDLTPAGAKIVFEGPGSWLGYLELLKTEVYEEQDKV